VVSRFTVLPAVWNTEQSPDPQRPVGDPDQGPSPQRRPELRWLATASRHWNIDRPDPR